MLHVNRQSHLRKFEQSQRANTNLDTTTEPYMALKLLVSVYNHQNQRGFFQLPSLPQREKNW